VFELRKKKDVLSEERSDMLCLFLNFGGSSVASRGDVSPLEILTSFPRREDEQKQSKVDIQRRRGRVPRYFLKKFCPLKGGGGWEKDQDERR